MKSIQQIVAELETAIAKRREKSRFVDQFDYYLDDAIAAWKLSEGTIKNSLEGRMVIAARNAGYGEIVGY